MIYQFLTCLVFASLTQGGFLNLADRECGESRIRDGRIVGGEEASPGQFPWLVSIRIKGMHWCGGAILSKKWILTAAHCVHEKSPSSLTVMAAVHNIHSSLPDAQQLSVSSIVRHKGFIYPKPKDDIALLQISSDINWSKNVKPACVARGSTSPPTGSVAMIAGWGWTHESKAEGSPASTLLKLVLPIVERAQCQEWFRENKKKLKIPESSMCAGVEEGGKDACQGDSGGPLMLTEGDKLVVVGVVSAGYGCARPRLPGLYTKVSAYTDWILKHVNDENLV
ncbi:trypsin-1-like [Artemia franciscana]|uniref:trypsin-1-like n=1 Tax=Artemia franciscana TaxID=6661 RepID=UPI0032DAE1B5